MTKPLRPSGRCHKEPHCQSNMFNPCCRSAGRGYFINLVVHLFLSLMIKGLGVVIVRPDLVKGLHCKVPPLCLTPVGKDANAIMNMVNDDNIWSF